MSWDKLSMQQRAEVMKLAIKNGIYDLNTIRNGYNEFAKGGTLPPPDTWTMEDENAYQQWRAKLPSNLRNTDDSQYDMRGAFKAGMQPTLEDDGYYHLGSRDPRTGRILKAATHSTYPLAVFSDARQGYYSTVDNQGNTYTQTWEGNEFRKGGNINIKPSHRGKLTELKERTGKTEAELYNDGNPAHKKMVVFARNARRWKHGLGGNLFRGGGPEDNKPNIFKSTNGLGEVRYFYRQDPDSEEITVHPQSTIFPDPAQWTFVDDNGRTYTPRISTPVPTAELNPDNRTGFERALDNYIGEAFNTVPKGYHTLPAIGAAAFGLASPALGEAALTSGFGAHGLSKWMNGEINGPLDAAITAVEILPLGQLTKPMLNTGVEVLEKYPALYQYPRYAIGKFKYGFDTQLPTLYRKVKNLPKIEDGRMMVSNPRSRFAFDNGYGEESPVITNFTTDAPVRSHSSGNWDRGLTLAFPGKTLLGKNVVSTRPSDTFTFGNNISVPVGNVTAFTGRPKEISFLQNSGVRTISSPDAEVFWKSGAADLADKIAKARATNAKIFSKRGSGITLLKPKTPVDNFDNYATTIENLARETFRSPTARDYEFMDYVFKPLYRSETIPKINDFTIQALDNNPALGEWIGNSERRRYLEDPWRWENLMYDPLTPIESEFRNNLNIGLKPEFKK